MRIVISEFMDTPPSMLRARFDVRYEPELVDRRNGLLQAMADADALIVRNRSQVDAALLASARPGCGRWAGWAWAWTIST